MAQTGVQILFAFLLILPFSANFKQVSPFERYVYFVTLLLATLASALMISPSPLHRILFRRYAKQQMVAVANVTTLAGLSCLALAMTGVVLLISDFLWGATTAIVATVSTALVFGALWYGLPLWVRSRLESNPARGGRDGSRDQEPRGR